MGRGVLAVLPIALVLGSCTPVPVPGGPHPIAIAAAGSPCALMSDTTVRCWGSNNFGQLGDGTNIDHTTPVEVSGLFGARQLSVGSDHACAVLDDDTVRCWGSNVNGQLGDAQTPLTSWWVPVTVDGLADVVEVRAGEDHTCALIADGTVQCWGGNGYGQLGDGGTVPSISAAPVVGLPTVTALDAGRYHSCALAVDDALWCWGGGAARLFGTGTYPLNSPTPLEIPLTFDLAAFGTGADKTCALDAGGAATCWGAKYRAGAGGAYGFYDDPVEVVEGVAGATSVVGSIDHMCATTADRAVSCWGRDIYSLRGLTTEPVNPDVATTVGGLPPTTQLAAGFGFTCALSTAHQVYCWGANYMGQFGAEEPTESRTPLLIPGL